jgi:hypothetical protein
MQCSAVQCSEVKWIMTIPISWLLLFNYSKITFINATLIIVVLIVVFSFGVGCLLCVCIFVYCVSFDRCVILCDEHVTSTNNKGSNIRLCYLTHSITFSLSFPHTSWWIGAFRKTEGNKRWAIICFLFMGIVTVNMLTGLKWLRIVSSSSLWYLFSTICHN